MNKKNRLMIGILYIILGIVTGALSYKHIFPFGSIILILLGLCLIFFWEEIFNYLNSKYKEV